MKLSINDTNVSTDGFRDDLKTYATQWIFEKQADIYAMANDIRQNPLLVNILHEWAAGYRRYEVEKAKLEEDMAAALLFGAEVDMTPAEMEERREFLYRLYGMQDYKRVLDDAIFHNC